MKRGYTVSLLLIFVLPFTLFFRRILRRVDRRRFGLTVAIVSVLGWAWSVLLARKRWWEFPRKHLCGVRISRNLPIEEFIIYPIGGALSVFFYELTRSRDGGVRNPAYTRTFITAVTAAFAALAIGHFGKKPYYLYSQLALYNGLCSALSPAVGRHLDPRGLAGSVGVLGTIGFIWDYLAFKLGWWTYHAVTGVRIKRIPIEDINFYLMAPTAAVSIYVALGKLFGEPGSPDLP